MSHSSEGRGERTQHDDERDGQNDDGPGISDADLPEELVAGEDNPLAEPLDDDVAREDLGMGTPGPDQHEGGDDDGDSDRDSED